MSLSNSASGRFSSSQRTPEQEAISRDSYAPLIMELTLVLSPTPLKPEQAAAYLDSSKENRSEGVRIARIPAHHYLQSLEIDFKIDAAWSGGLELFDKNDALADEFLLAGTGAQRYIVLRWGWDNPGAPVESVRDAQQSAKDAIKMISPSYVANISKGKQSVAYEGTTYSFDLTGLGVVDESMNALVTRRFAAGKTATEIFQLICKELGWKMCCEASEGKMGDFVIAGRDGPIQGLQLLASRAHNKQNDAFTFFLDEKGIAHFHSCSYGNCVSNDGNGQPTGGSQTTAKVARMYTFAVDAMGEVISFDVEDDLVFNYLAGAGPARFGGVDSKTGEPIESASTKDKGLDKVQPGKATPDSRFIFDIMVRSTIRDRMAEAAYVPIRSRTAEEFRQIATAIHNKLRNVAFNATLIVKGTHGIRTGNHVQVNRYTANGNLHYYSGTYTVVGVKHQIDTGGWQTTLELTRTGLPQVMTVGMIQQDFLPMLIEWLKGLYDKFTGWLGGLSGSQSS